MPRSAGATCLLASVWASACITIRSISPAASSSAWRMLVRDARAGELSVLAAALVIACASVTSVGFFADRVGQALARDAHQLLGADVVFAADHPWNARIVQRVRSAGASAEAMSFV